MECTTVLPGPAGLLQQARARGVHPGYVSGVINCANTNPLNGTRSVTGNELDFQTRTWRTALEAFDLQEFEENSALHDTVSTALTGHQASVSKLIVMVVSMEFTAGGDVFARLKDPTGTIGAALHQEVMESEPDICPGAVLLLEKVTILAFGPTLKYLVIALDNMMQVITPTRYERMQRLPRTMENAVPAASSAMNASQANGFNGQCSSFTERQQHGGPARNALQQAASAQQSQSAGNLFATQRATQIPDRRQPGQGGEPLPEWDASGNTAQGCFGTTSRLATQQQRPGIRAEPVTSSHTMQRSASTRKTHQPATDGACAHGSALWPNGMAAGGAGQRTHANATYSQHEGNTAPPSHTMQAPQPTQAQQQTNARQLNPLQPSFPRCAPQSNPGVASAPGPMPHLGKRASSLGSMAAQVDASRPDKRHCAESGYDVGICGVDAVTGSLRPQQAFGGIMATGPAAGGAGCARRHGAQAGIQQNGGSQQFSRIAPNFDLPTAMHQQTTAIPQPNHQTQFADDMAELMDGLDDF